MKNLSRIFIYTVVNYQNLQYTYAQSSVYPTVKQHNLTKSKQIQR